MSELDGTKEEIAYLKLWLGITIVTGISLVGWLFAGFESTHWFLVLSGFVALLAIGVGCFMVHKQIQIKIDQVRRL
ncbi:MAG: hypothetical protein H0V62_12230 [Gammaproteobacteria bacterium]|nr:hypothetical protein [Gammaproteobacteria bacterium]